MEDLSFESTRHRSVFHMLVSFSFLPQKKSTKRQAQRNESNGSQKFCGQTKQKEQHIFVTARKKKHLFVNCGCSVSFKTQPKPVQKHTIKELLQNHEGLGKRLTKLQTETKKRANKILQNGHIYIYMGIYKALQNPSQITQKHIQKCFVPSTPFRLSRLSLGPAGSGKTSLLWRLAHEAMLGHEGEARNC